MRHETCVNCATPQVTDPNLIALVLVSESLGDLAHHHHTMKCEGCGAWWFDDVVIGGLGIFVPSRRDTVLCECDDGLAQYVQSAIMVPAPESECACTSSDVEKFSLPIRLGGPQ